jgi:hypothetical protein
MSMKRRRDWRNLAVGLLLFLLVAGSGRRSASAGARNPCLEEGNLTQNCGFDTFVDDWVGEKRYQIPAAWWYFILAGDPDYRPSDDTYWGAPSLWMLTDGVPFTAGIYQQVAVTPGVVYQTDIGWAAVSQEDFERKLGLDPTGGTDPLAPTVIWSRSEWAMTRWPDLTVSARATGPTMTVFVWVHHPRAYGMDWVFLDAVGLWPDPSQPAATVTPVPSLTPTRRPPTRTPSPVSFTNTPAASATATPTDTPTPTPTPTLTPTSTPTASPTPTWTATPTLRPPTATPYPTRTPLPTIVPVAELVASTESEDIVEAEGPAGGDSGDAVPYVVVGASVIVAVVLAGMAGAWLLRRKNATGE